MQCFYFFCAEIKELKAYNRRKGEKKHERMIDKGL